MSENERAVASAEASGPDPLESLAGDFENGAENISAPGAFQEPLPWDAEPAIDAVRALDIVLRHLLREHLEDAHPLELVAEIVLDNFELAPASSTLIYNGLPARLEHIAAEAAP